MTKRGTIQGHSYLLTDTNYHIDNSCEVRKDLFCYFYTLRLTPQTSESQVWQRSDFSLSMEWASHNFAYKLGIARKRTASVDLNYPQKWYVKALYTIVGLLGWIFIK